MAGLTLDAGALIAAERRDRDFWVLYVAATARGVVLGVPTAALAQAWRGSRSARLAQLLETCEIEPLDEQLAKRAGELCSRTRTRDVVDASVVVTANRRGDDVLTTDAADLRRLVTQRSRTKIIDLRKAKRR